MSSVTCICGFDIRDEYSGRILSWVDMDTVYRKIEDYIENDGKAKNESPRDASLRITGIIHTNFSRRIWQCPECFRLMFISDKELIFLNFEDNTQAIKII